MNVNKIDKEVKILVFSVPSWNSKVGANSWAALLESYPSRNIASVSIRDDIPDSPVCGRYFTISENRIIKSILNRKIKTGYEVTTAAYAESLIDLSAQKRRYSRYQKRRNYLMLLVREMVWKLGKWKTKEFDSFLDDFQPDLILHSMDGYIHMNRIVKYAIQRTSAKAIGYIWDDNFTYNVSNSLGFKVYRYFQRRSLKSLAKITDNFFSISERTKLEADAFFHIDSTVLTKPLNSIPKFEEKEYAPPYRILYTGSLIIGRDETLKTLINILEWINIDKLFFVLDIYTGTGLTEKDRDYFNKPYIQLHEAIPQSEILKKQQETDILLFLEALSGSFVNSARLSFSTKITDYLSCGKPILAIGNRNNCPIAYFIENDAALTACDEMQIKKVLKEILSNPQILNQYAENACACGIRNHAPEKIMQTFNRVIEKTVGQRKELSNG